MALQDITQKIVDDARAQRKEIMTATRVEVQKIIADAEADAKEAERTSDTAQEERMAHEEQMALSRARRTFAQKVSAQKRAALDAVLEGARAEVIAASASDYVTFLTNTIRHLDDDAKGMAAQAHVPTNRVALTEKLFAQHGMAATVVADDNVKAGFLLVGKDADYDATLDRYMDDHARTVEAKVTTSLFAK